MVRGSRSRDPRPAGTSPNPPLVLTFRATVLTMAAHRHQRSGDRAQSRMASAEILPASHAGPERVRAKLSTDDQLFIRLASSSSFFLPSAPNALG